MLSWTDGGDLDLHLVGDDGERVNYLALGCLDASPWMQLECDERHPGTERGAIARQRRGRCAVQVHLYDGEAPSPGAATVEVSLGRNRRTFTAHSEAWPVWNVCTIDLEAGGIETDELPDRVANPAGT